MEFVTEVQEQGRMGFWSSIQGVSLKTENSQRSTTLASPSATDAQGPPTCNA